MKYLDLKVHYFTDKDLPALEDKVNVFLEGLIVAGRTCTPMPITIYTKSGFTYFLQTIWAYVKPEEDKELSEEIPEEIEDLSILGVENE